MSGIIATFFPRKCSSTLDSQEKGKQPISPAEKQTLQVTVKGHHPDCGEFPAHVIRVEGHFFCAACTGLFLGALLALLGTILYFFVGLEFVHIGFLVVLIGQAGIILGFVQLKFKNFIRSALNAFFVFGAYLVLMGVDMIGENALIDFYLIGLIIFWIWTRILLSQWDHWRTCQACKLNCELKKNRD
jgi:hypothetical protein